MNKRRKKIISHSKPSISLRQCWGLNLVYLKRNLSTGLMVDKLEKSLQNLHHRDCCKIVNSGTSAMHILLQSIVKCSEDEVILPGYSCCDLANAVLLAGAKPVFTEVNEFGESNYESIKSRVTDKTVAVIVQHIFGKSFVDRRLERLHVRIIEDCTYTFESYYEMSDIVISMGATKLVSGGECGAVLTNSKELAKKIICLMSPENYIRYPYRQSDIHASIALQQIKELVHYKQRRIKIAQEYTRHLNGIAGIRLMWCNDDWVPYRFIIRFQDSKVLDYCLAYLHSQGIMCEKPISIHMLAKQMSTPNHACCTLLSIPIYPHLKRYEQKIVIKAIRNCVRFSSENGENTHYSSSIL